jgi:hypothetical protein
MKLICCSKIRYWIDVHQDRFIVLILFLYLWPKYGDFPVHMAARNGHSVAVDILLSHQKKQVAGVLSNKYVQWLGNFAPPPPIQ